MQVDVTSTNMAHNDLKLCHLADTVISADSQERVQLFRQISLSCFVQTEDESSSNVWSDGYVLMMLDLLHMRVSC